MMDPPPDDSPELRQHIRDLLLDYVHQHLTIDYDQYTIQCAEEVISSFSFLFAINSRNPASSSFRQISE